MTRPMMSDADRADAFRGLAHPLRRKLLAALARGDKSVNELLAGTGLTQPALSRHLLILRDTGLVTHRAVGSRRYYRLNRPVLRRARQWLQQNT